VKKGQGVVQQQKTRLIIQLVMTCIKYSTSKKKTKGKILTASISKREAEQGRSTTREKRRAVNVGRGSSQEKRRGRGLRKIKGGL